MLTHAEFQAIGLTLLVSTTAVLTSLPIALAVGWLLAKRVFPGKACVEAIVNLPLVLPPVVTGYFLLVTFGRNGWIGYWLEQGLGMRFVFDWKGAALASAVVGFPLMVRPIRQSFAAVDWQLIQAARTLGARPFDAFLTVLLPLAYPGILSGSILAFARSMGEFGATLMIAGNIPGVTRTIPLFIYSELDAPGGMTNSLRLIVFAVVIATAALLASEWLDRRGRRWQSWAALES